MNFLKNLTGRDIAVIITSVGGVILAGYIMHLYSQSLKTSSESIEKLAGNHINHNTQAVTELTEAVKGFKEEQKETRKTMEATNQVIQANTSLLKNIFNK